MVVAARRTPFARLDGDLRAVDAQALAAAVIAAVVADAGVAGHVDDVILATATGPGGNLARRAALQAGLGQETPGLTLDRQCGGGLDAVTLACRLVESGAGEVYVAAGVESASTSPLRAAPGIDRRPGGGTFFPRHPFAADGFDDPGMVEAAEQMAAALSIPREAQDAWAILSHTRAAQAAAAGAFRDEIVPVAGVAHDGCPRPRMDASRAARMRPLLGPDGTVTAANSSQIADGAAAVVVMSATRAARAGLAGILHRDSVTVGVDPASAPAGAAAALAALLRRNPDLRREDVAHWALVEAFAVQAAHAVDHLGLPADRLNPHGGAVGLGHPWGASGTAQIVRLAHHCVGDGVALAGVAGGMGHAAWFTPWPG